MNWFFSGADHPYLVAIAIIGLVLMQHGKGLTWGSVSVAVRPAVFGATGSANFLSRTTGVLAAVVF